MIVGRYPDITRMWEGITEMALWSPDSIIDFSVHGSRIISSDNMIQCEGCEFNFDLNTVGFTAKTFSKFLHKYFEPRAIREWVAGARSQTQGVDNFLSTVNPGHKWGACFLGISYRSRPQPRITLYSRSAIMPTAGTLELALCSLLARELGSSPSFLWLAGSIWWSSLKLLPYLSYYDLLERMMQQNTVLGRSVKSDYLGISSGAQTWGGRRRALTKALAVRGYAPIPISGLSLE
jgi:hypothetical protein